MPRLRALIAVGLLCALVVVVPSPRTSAPPAGGSSVTAPLTPEGLAAYVGEPAVSAALHHRIETVGLGTRGALDPLANVSWLAFDPANLAFYIAVDPATVDVIPDTGSLVVATAIPVGAEPFGVAVDSRSGNVFVTNAGSDNVSVISPATETVVASVDVGSAPHGIAYDPTDDELFVANSGSGSVTVISGATLTAVATVSVGQGPVGVAYDAGSGSVVVANFLSDSVTMISAASRTAIGSVGVGAGPYGVAVDPGAGTVYVTNQLSSNVSVVATGSFRVVATVPVLYPNLGERADLQGIAFDPRDGYIWAGAGAFYAVVIDPSSQTVVDFVNTDPSGVVYDPSSGNVCVTNTANVTFACFLFPADASAATSVRFAEHGLPAGAAWAASLGSLPVMQSSNSSTLEYGVLGPLGPLPYTVWPASGFSVNPSGGALNVTSGNGSLTVNVTFTRSPGPYSVEFVENGLPGGTTWGVTLAGVTTSATTSSIVFDVPSGTYPYSLAPVPGWGASGLPTSGQVAVNGAPVSVGVVQYSPYRYLVEFDESGLPTTTGWSVTFGAEVGRSTGASMNFSAANGTYAYLVGAIAGFLVPPGGSVTVHGANVTVDLTFRVTFGVTFGEAGLPPGTGWNVTIGATTVRTVTGLAEFNETNGTYVFAVTAPAGYSAAPSSGIVIVAGAPATQGIAFAPIPPGEYAVTFTETGLVAGIGWSVTVSNATLLVHETGQAVSPSPITFDLPNGTYVWGVFVPAGYSAGIPPGPLVVAGAPAQPTALSFTTTGGGPTPGPALPWSELVASVTVALVAGGLIGWFVRRRRSA